MRSLVALAFLLVGCVSAEPTPEPLPQGPMGLVFDTHPGAGDPVMRSLPGLVEGASTLIGPQLEVVTCDGGDCFEDWTHLALADEAGDFLFDPLLPPEEGVDDPAAEVNAWYHLQSFLGRYQELGFEGFDEPAIAVVGFPFDDWGILAGATGLDDRPAVLFSRLDDFDIAYDPDVYGHELGHLSSEHVQMHLAAALVIAGAHMVLPSFVSLPLTRALLLWYRRGELTCDRAGLLGCRDLGASLTALAKLCGGNGPGTRSRTTLRLEPFVRQAREMALAQEGDKVNDLLSTLLVLNRTHPFVVARAMHLIDWVEHGSYLELLAGGAAR